MKVIYFLQWWWKKIDTWQKLWLIACFLFGVGLANDGPSKMYFLSVLPAFVVVSVIKWACWDGITNAWLEYNKEQEQLIRIMKNKGTE